MSISVIFGAEIAQAVVRPLMYMSSGAMLLNSFWMVAFRRHCREFERYKDKATEQIQHWQNTAFQSEARLLQAEKSQATSTRDNYN